MALIEMTRETVHASSAGGGIRTLGGGRTSLYVCFGSMAGLCYHHDTRSRIAERMALSEVCRLQHQWKTLQAADGIGTTEEKLQAVIVLLWIDMSSVRCRLVGKLRG